MVKANEKYDLVALNLEALYKYTTENDNISKIDKNKVYRKNIIQNVLRTIDKITIKIILSGQYVYYCPLKIIHLHNF